MEIVNIVAVAEMKEPFDLLLILEKLKNTEFTSHGARSLKNPFLTESHPVLVPKNISTEKT